MALHVFPQTVTQPRKSSLKKPRTSSGSSPAGELKGVAFEVNTHQPAPGVVQAGNQRIKHALYCDPLTSRQNTSNHGSLRRHKRASKRSSVASDSTLIRCDSALDDEEGHITIIPEADRLAPHSLQTRSSLEVESPTLPHRVSTITQPGADMIASPGGDTLYPLPDDNHIRATSSVEEPTTRSLRSTTPTPIQGDSPTITVPPYSPHDPAQRRSIFPQWDPSKPLNEQNYYPHARSPTPTLPPEKVSKDTSRSQKRLTLPALDMQHVEPAATVVVGYEHIPVATSSDLLEVFNASCNKPTTTGRKALFQLRQPRSKGTALGIGLSEDSLLWSMRKEAQPSSAKDTQPSDQLVISKHEPGKPDTIKVAQLVLPEPGTSPHDSADDTVAIFPHMAAIQAIESIANTPAAAALAKVDPTATSAQAARLAQDAVAEARRHYQSLLIRNTRSRDTLGAVTAGYQLQHPTLGLFAITVTKSSAARHSRDPRAKISLHHPSATPAAIAAETLVLAFLDFARDGAVLDVPGLLALEGLYILDTVLCALLAVAVVENDALMAETMTFAAPPKSPLPAPGSKKSKRNSRAVAAAEGVGGGEEEATKASSGGLFRRRNKKKNQKGESSSADLPALTQGALAVLGLSFKVALWTLEMGVKATAGVIVGTSHLISKA